MSKKPSIPALLAMMTLAAVPLVPSEAHHSFAMFDQSKQVKLEGVVREFQFTNPHSWIQLLVTPTAGAPADEWAIELLSPNILARQGWKKNTIKPGDKVSVLINPMRDGSKGGNLITVTLPDGVTLGGGA